MLSAARHRTDAHQTSMRRLMILVVIAAVLATGACGDETDGTETGAGGATTTTIAGSTTTVPGTDECGMVGFTPDSEDAASDIKATGLSCDAARSFVGVAGRRTSATGPREVEVEGYHCVRVRSEQDPLPRSFYECTNGSMKVAFVRT